MEKRISDHLRSNVVGYVALFFALTMGTAYATHPGGANTISTADIQNQAVTTPKIANDAVTNQKIEPLTIRENSIRGSAVTNEKIAQQTIRAGRLADEAVSTAKLADAAVDSGKVLDDSLTGDDIAPQGIGSTELAPNAINSSALVADGSLRYRDYAKVRAQNVPVDIPNIAAHTCIIHNFSNNNTVDVLDVVQALPPVNPEHLGLVYYPARTIVDNQAQGYVCNITASAINPPPTGFDLVVFQRPPG